MQVMLSLVQFSMMEILLVGGTGVTTDSVKAHLQQIGIEEFGYQCLLGRMQFPFLWVTNMAVPFFTMVTSLVGVRVTMAA
tara:strand:- start:278 stop:517 length:240 start_codon:yes stop_codon:yes gene_type:complete